MQETEWKVKDNKHDFRTKMKNAFFFSDDPLLLSKQTILTGNDLIKKNKKTGIYIHITTILPLFLFYEVYMKRKPCNPIHTFSIELNNLSHLC